MCGRFVASRPIEDLARLLEVDEIDVPPGLDRPRWNVSPQSSVLAVTAARDVEGQRRLAAFRWGLVPSWAKDPGIGARAFNARAETAAAKPMFRAALARRRCVVPADAFYEWTPAAPGAASRRKQPWCFERADGGVLLLAGLWEVWRPKAPEPTGREAPEPTGREAPEPTGPEAPSNDGPPAPNEALRTCTILTTEANALLGRFHHRMPVVIDAADLDQWLAPEPLEPGELAALLRPAPDDLLEAWAVSTAVNDARAEGPDLVEPIASEGLLPEAPAATR